MFRPLIIGACLSVAAAALTVPLTLRALGPVPAASLSDRIGAARADLLSRPCGGDADCFARVASHGLEPAHFDAPEEWLSAECASHDGTACAYLSAWREVEARQ